MSKFFIEQEVTRVSFPDGEWADIKSEFTQEDLDFITNTMMTTKYDGKQPEVSMSFGKQATLERAIVAWSFKDGDKPIPVTPENVSNLRSKYRWLLLKEIDRLNKESGEFLKN